MKLKAKNDYYSIFGRKKLLTKGKIYTVVNPFQALCVFDDSGEWNRYYLEQFVPEDMEIK